MITYRLGIYHQDLKNARDFAEAVKRQKGSCDTVWLITDHYFPSLERHRKFAEAWLPAAEIYREAGLEVAIQTAQTFGHGDPSSPLAESRIAGMTDGQGVVRDLMVGPDGTQNIACFCWRGEYYIDYMKKALSAYAEVLKPSRFWLDDDVRATNHMPNKYGCFCDNCIAKFNGMYGSAFTREELVSAINYGDPVWRERFVEFGRRGLYDFVYSVTKAILAVSPDTAMGYEFGHFSSYCGGDVSYVFDAMRDAGAKHIHSRPGAGNYNDKAPYGQFEKAFDLARENVITPDYVESMDAELENLPGVLYGKSIGGIINESILDLAVGCNGITLTDVQSMHEPIGYYERIFSALSEARPYFERLSEVSFRGYRGGACIYQSKKPFATEPNENEAPFAWAERYVAEKDIPFTRLGIPLCFEDRAPSSYILKSGFVDAMSDAEIENLLSKPVLTDADSVAKIISRGFGEYFGTEPIRTKESGFERFTDDEINGSRAGMFYDENPYASTPMPHYIFDGLSEKDRVLGVLQRSPIFSDGLDIGACTVITEVGAGEKKAKWAIFGYSLWNDIVSAAKRNQVLGVLDAISPLPARICEDAIAALYTSVDEDGRLLSATVASASQSGTDDITLIVRNPASRTAELMGAKRERAALAVEKNENGELFVKLPALAPYEIITVFFNNVN